MENINNTWEHYSQLHLCRTGGKVYVVLLHIIGLFSIVLFTSDKCVCIFIDLAWELYSQWSETHTIKPLRLHSSL